ncbi:HlyD family secretion protein [Shewanella schlegeliana]|uniref:HlyD family secretion protein n=1 Tax=Shewanella schlegeliana TaxID=190308 RepID=A0ABS1SVB0_9GAMM|nr:HlyD family secretion protein [Shewanella schlegeliana]MBL4912339.1 HlyD family secretion protein [Shewanella schlegeliana]MCL1108192.1 HlyD family secretion protein [Shewanella schlegeliana]GIU22132.1 MFP transporter [Shewanella schlegeliana]
MDLLLVLTYTAVCIAIFKIFKIPLTKWTVPTAILGGIFIVGALILLMNYNHPYTPFAKEYFVTTPINPAVRGVVVSVEVEPNTPIKKGDVLFRIDPTPFQAIVKQKRAALVAAELEVPQLEAAWETAKAAVTRATADRDRTKSAFERYEKGRKRGGVNSPFTELELDNKRQFYFAAEAQLTAANAEELRVRLAYESNVDGVNTKVAGIQGELEKAQFDLEQTVVKAPADGMVTQMALRPGIVAVPMPLRPLLSFIPDEERAFVGAFWQNSLLRLKEGDEAEIILDAAPGQVFKGKVAKVLPAMAEGEIQSSGSLISSQRVMNRGRALVLIKLEDHEVKKEFPAGVSGHAAIYTEHFAHVSIMRKVLLRMQGWLNYLFH